MISHPDEILVHHLETCPECQQDLRAVPPEKLEKRQVFDIPPMRMLVREHQSEVKPCLCTT